MEVRPSRMATVRRTSPATAWSWVTMTMVVPSCSFAVRKAAKICSAVCGVEFAGGLVGEQDGGGVGQGHGDGDALLLAAGHLVRAAVAAVGDAQQLQEFQGAFGLGAAAAVAARR